jgi:hypothetical protein
LNYLIIHQSFPEYEVHDGRLSLELVLLHTLDLTLRGGADKFPHQVELPPMKFIGISRMGIWISFMSTDEIRHVYFSNVVLTKKWNVRMKAKNAQSRNASALGILQTHTISAVRATVLKE